VPKQSLERIVIVRLSSVGDVVLTGPATALLREAYPSAEIGFVVKGSLRDLVAGNPHVDTIHVLEESSLAALRSLAREIGERRYDAFVDLHRNLRSAFLARASGARLRTAYVKRELRDAFAVRIARRPFRASKRLVERYVESLAPLGIAPAYRRPVFHVAGSDAEWADGYLAGSGLVPHGYVAVVPGSVWPTKRWSAERYAALAARVAARLDLPVVLLGSRDEIELCETVAAGAGSGARVAAGQTTLGQMAALISRATLYVGNDSGPTHIAMAVDTPTVAIFGPTDPGQFDFERHALVYADLECSACSFFGGERCRLGHWDCIGTIGVDDVYAKAGALLERRGREAGRGVASPRGPAPPEGGTGGPG